MLPSCHSLDCYREHVLESGHWDAVPRIHIIGSSLNAVVVFNFEVTHAALFALKTTTAFNEEPKKENPAWKAEENTRIIAKISRFSGKNGVIFAYFCSQSTKSDICV